jgi:hypothetical protein
MYPFSFVLRAPFRKVTAIFYPDTRYRKVFWKKLKNDLPLIADVVATTATFEPVGVGGKAKSSGEVGRST